MLHTHVAWTINTDKIGLRGRACGEISRPPVPMYRVHLCTVYCVDDR